MAKRKDAKKRDTCYLCDAEASTRDHIPPKGVFPDPKPTDLITVPCCAECNSATKLDDEYFRWVILTASTDNPNAADFIKQHLIPKFQKRPALLRKVMKGAVKVNILSPSGIFLEQRPGFCIEASRVQPIIEKIVKGLYFRETGTRLPDDFIVEDFKLNPTFDESCWQEISQLPLQDVGGGVFSYRFYKFEEQEGKSIWYLMFFDKTLIVAVTNPKTSDVSSTPIPQANPDGS